MGNENARPHFAQQLEIRPHVWESIWAKTRRRTKRVMTMVTTAIEQRNASW